MREKNKKIIIALSFFVIYINANAETINVEQDLRKVYKEILIKKHEEKEKNSSIPTNEANFNKSSSDKRNFKKEDNGHLSDLSGVVVADNVKLDETDEVILRNQENITKSILRLDDKTFILYHLNTKIAHSSFLLKRIIGEKKDVVHFDIAPVGIEGVELTNKGLKVNYVNKPFSYCEFDTKWFSNHGVSYYPLCEGVLWKREELKGFKSQLEKMTDLLRDNGGAIGEQLINVYKDMFPKKGDVASDDQMLDASNQQNDISVSPKIAISSKASNTIANNLGIPLKDGIKSLKEGAWYQVAGAKYPVYVSVATPSFLKDTVYTEDANGLVYLMGLNITDPKRLRFNYYVGTDHPGLGWSSRPPINKEGSGPDGFNVSAPFKRVGMMPPWVRPYTVMVFNGGFKREHSAFRLGDLATTDGGHHYGFISDGFLFSKLHNDLATFLQEDNQAPIITNMSAKFNGKNLWFARQNGLLLLENGKPTVHANNYYSGNWSGNAQGNILTMRSGICIQQKDNESYLIYAVFSAATPKIMSQVFKAYGCTTAMQLDMNSPELTYAAVMVEKDGKLKYAPLLTSMNLSDFEKREMGRFIDTPDSRDFFSISLGNKQFK